MDTTGTDRLIRDLVTGDRAAIDGLVARAPGGYRTTELVAAALLVPGGRHLLEHALAAAVTSGQRRVVAVAAAHLDGDADRALLLARDHLADQPDHLFVACLAAALTARRNP